MSGFTEPTLEDALLAEQRADEGRRRRDEGTNQATNGAHPWVKANLERHLDRWISSGVPFTSDDLRRDAEPIATNPNLVGALIRQASASGRIRMVGWRESSRPEARGRAVRQWQAVTS